MHRLNDMDGKLRNMTSVYLYDEEGILCLYRVGSRVANNKYVGSAGGHFEPNELNDARKCILREMEEELGLRESDVADLRLRYVTHRLVNNEIRQNYYFFGRLFSRIELSSTEGQLRWFSYEHAADLDMPLSAKHMMLHYLREGRYTDLIYGGITEKTGTTFVTMKDFSD